MTILGTTVRVFAAGAVVLAGLISTHCTATATLVSGLGDDDDGPLFGADDDDATDPDDDDTTASDDDSQTDDDTTAADDDSQTDDDTGDDDAADDDTDPCAGLGTPQADIIQPTNTATFEVGETIHFTASTTDDADLPSHLLLSWTDQLYAVTEVWSVPGPDASGVITFTRDDLDEGIHVITLEAQDSDGCIGADAIGLELVP